MRISRTCGRLLAVVVIGATGLGLALYHRFLELSASVMEANHAAYEAAWQDAHRLCISDFRTQLTSNTLTPLTPLTNVWDCHFGWSHSDTVAWLRTTYVDQNGTSDEPVVPWSEIESHLTAECQDSLRKAIDALNELTIIQFPTRRREVRTCPAISGLLRLDAGLILELGLLLHRRQREEAWLHVIALTKLATRFKPAPNLIFYEKRLEMLQGALTAFWGFGRSFPVSEQEVGEFLEPWQRMTVLEAMPDIVALDRCEYMRGLMEQRLYGQHYYSLQTLSELIRGQRSLLQSGSQLWYAPRVDSQQWSYYHFQTYVDERHLIELSCRREKAMNQALQGNSWAQIVAEHPSIHDSHLQFSPNSRAATLVNLSQLSRRFSSGLRPAQTEDPYTEPFVETESLRRLVIAGLTVRLHILREGRAPESLQDVSNIPFDFRSGRPFLYRAVPPRDFELVLPTATNSLPVRPFDPEKIYPRIYRPGPVAWPAGA